MLKTFLCEKAGWRNTRITAVGKRQDCKDPEVLPSGRQIFFADCQIGKKRMEPDFFENTWKNVHRINKVINIF